jgi:hypothetical protein
MIRPHALSQSVPGYAPTCCCHCEVVDPHGANPITGRPDAAILEMKELGDNVFYGG